jgi:hypothetical protein
MSRNSKNGSIHKLPAADSIGSLEPIAFFHDAMPTGLTVSHKGRIFVNFPKWGDNVQYSVAEVLKDGSTIAYPDMELNRTDENDKLQHWYRYSRWLLILVTGYGFWILVVPYFSLLNMEVPS